MTCPPISVDGGDIVFTDDQNFGSVASYSCFNGNTLDMVTTTRTCLEDGEWSGYNPACNSKKLYSNSICLKARDSIVMLMQPQIVVTPEW